jgi:hypothetical protein
MRGVSVLDGDPLLTRHGLEAARPPHRSRADTDSNAAIELSDATDQRLLSP